MLEGDCSRLDSHGEEVSSLLKGGPKCNRFSSSLFSCVQHLPSTRLHVIHKGLSVRRDLILPSGRRDKYARHRQ